MERQRIDREDTRTDAEKMVFKSIADKNLKQATTVSWRMLTSGRLDNAKAHFADHFHSARDRAILRAILRVVSFVLLNARGVNSRAISSLQ